MTFVSAGVVQTHFRQHLPSEATDSSVTPAESERVGEQPVVPLEKLDRRSKKRSVPPGLRRWKTTSKVLKISGLLAATIAFSVAVFKLASCRARLDKQKEDGSPSNVSPGGQTNRKLAVGGGDQPPEGGEGTSGGNCSAEEKNVAEELAAVEEQVRLARIAELKKLKDQKDLFIAQNGRAAFVALQSTVRLGKAAGPALGYEYLEHYGYYQQWLGFASFGQREEEELERLLEEQKWFEARKKAGKGSPV